MNLKHYVFVYTYYPSAGRFQLVITQAEAPHVPDTPARSEPGAGSDDPGSLTKGRIANCLLNAIPSLRNRGTLTLQPRRVKKALDAASVVPGDVTVQW